ncbi:MAG: arginase family protein [Candidatus Njordarchaeota archaeon]
MFRKYHSFFGFPRTTLDGIARNTIAIVGSTAVSKSIHPDYGQKQATKTLRALSLEYDTHNLYISQELENYDIVDLGDFPKNIIGRIIQSIFNNDAKALVIGGDHTTTYYCLSKTPFRDIAIFDAHLDAEELDIKNFHHGSVTRRLITEIPTLNVKIVGFRGYSTMKKELEFLQNKKNVKILSWPIQDNIIQNIIQQTNMISIDLDFFDPTSFWSVRVPEVFGADFSWFVNIIHRTEKTCARYIDIVEYCPKIDNGYICGKKLLQLILEILALLARS